MHYSVIFWGGITEDQPPSSLIFFSNLHLPDEIMASLKLPGFACSDRRSCSLTAGGLGSCKPPPVNPGKIPGQGAVGEAPGTS